MHGVLPSFEYYLLQANQEVKECTLEGTEYIS